MRAELEALISSESAYTVLASESAHASHVRVATIRCCGEVPIVAERVGVKMLIVASRMVPRITPICCKAAVLNSAPAVAQKPSSAAARQNPGGSSCLSSCLSDGSSMKTCATAAMIMNRNAVIVVGVKT